MTISNVVQAAHLYLSLVFPRRWRRGFAGTCIGLFSASLHCVATDPVPSLPSIATVAGHQLMVQRRNPDNTLQTAEVLPIRGVNYSPASKNTNTTKNDANNANVRRAEFGNWYAVDMPLLQAMKVNVIRLPFDPGVDGALGPVGLAMLDAAYTSGIYVLMTVDDGINNTDRVQQAVSYYKNHPAILGWILGNEFNINYYYGAASSISDAVQRTQTAASLIKALDTNHPVFAGYGEIDINDTGRRLADTQNYVAQCTFVDAWCLNIYRGASFGTLFTQWQSITAKPMFIGEFGADSFHTTNPSASPPVGAVNETEQRDWNISLWNEIFANLSSRNAASAALGGCLFEWADEWWKISGTVILHNTEGFYFGMPDGFSNEEYFGLVDIDRTPRLVYTAFQTAYDPAYSPPLPTVRTVTNLNDSGPGSLRDTIAASVSGDIITFNVTGTINLSIGEIVVNKSLNIQGPGSASLTVARASGGSASRVFNVSVGVVAISGVSISGGSTSDMGGGIANAAILTLTGCVVSGNSAWQGGGVMNTGTLTIQDCVFSNNTAGGNGGAIRNDGNLSVARTSFTGSAAGYYGGTVYNRAQAVLDSCSMGSSYAPTGGALWNENQNFTVTNTTLYNSSAVIGGALANKNGSVTLSNVTVFGCISTGSGGAIYNGVFQESGGTLTLICCTLANNYANLSGGGLYVAVGTVSARNTILANNTAGGAGPDCYGALFSQDYNLIRDTGGCTLTGTTTHNITNLDPLLGPLQNNGGPTFTLALLVGSPAINAGDNSVLNNPFSIVTDQRSFRRKSGVAVDIGAFEQTYFAIWSAAHGLTGIESGLTEDFDHDNLTNLMEMAFGTDPSVASAGVIRLSGPSIIQRGSPTTWIQNIANGVDYRAIYGRRKDFEEAGLTYTVQFSADLLNWVNSTETPTVIGGDSEIDAVTVSYPFFINGRKARFFRVQVTSQ